MFILLLACVRVGGDIGSADEPLACHEFAVSTTSGSAFGEQVGPWWRCYTEQPGNDADFLMFAITCQVDVDPADCYCDVDWDGEQDGDHFTVGDAGAVDEATWNGVARENCGWHIDYVPPAG